MMDTVNTVRDEYLCQQNITLCISINYLGHLDGVEEVGKTNFKLESDKQFIFGLSSR